MLVYANFLRFHGPDAPAAVFKAVGAWLKHQLGYGLHPKDLTKNGQHEGQRGAAKSSKSWLQILTATGDQPELFCWILKHTDDSVSGRQWVTELGAKIYAHTVDFSCVLRTDDQSTLINDPVRASRPRVIAYAIHNVTVAANARVDPSTPGLHLRTVGPEADSYRALLAEIERHDRTYPIVLISPTLDGRYLLPIDRLQEHLIGLAQVVKIDTNFNSYEMEAHLGKQWSAWSGAINVFYIPHPNGKVRNHLFLSNEIVSWGAVNDRLSHILAHITSNTNVPRLRQRIRPEGVIRSALARRLASTRAKSQLMNADELRCELERAHHDLEQIQQWADLLEKDNSRLQNTVTTLESRIAELDAEVSRRIYEIQALKDALSAAGHGRATTIDAEYLLDALCRSTPPSPTLCLEILEHVYGDKCIILESARKSAQEIHYFSRGLELLILLRRLVTDYRDTLIKSGDSEARKVFTPAEFAAKESDTVMRNKELRRSRTFDYDGKKVEMYRHLKIGIDDDVTRTLRIHFYWDSARKKIVIGYCGKHLPIATH